MSHSYGCAKHWYADCQIVFVMLSIDILSVTVYFVLLSVIMLSTAMLGNVMLSVIAPFKLNVRQCTLVMGFCEEQRKHY